jgi:hypothetical protein
MFKFDHDLRPIQKGLGTPSANPCRLNYKHGVSEASLSYSQEVIRFVSNSLTEGVPFCHDPLLGYDLYRCSMSACGLQSCTWSSAINEGRPESGKELNCSFAREHSRGVPAARGDDRGIRFRLGDALRIPDDAAHDLGILRIAQMANRNRRLRRWNQEQVVPLQFAPTTGVAIIPQFEKVHGTLMFARPSPLCYPVLTRINLHKRARTDQRIEGVVVSADIPIEHFLQPGLLSQE